MPSVMPSSLVSCPGQRVDTKKACIGLNFSGTVQKRLENSNMVGSLWLALFKQISFSYRKVQRKTLTGSVCADFENPETSQPPLVQRA